MRRVSRTQPGRAVELMLDSGAFTAWKRGAQIDLSQYIAFLQRNADLLAHYVNLDVIPGVMGQRVALEQVEEAAAQSFANYEVMRAAGLSPIPVFHYGEDLRWLRRILDSGAAYIGLGGTVGRPRKVRIPFFDRCFAVLREYPGVRVHGFGTTSLDLMRRYPWTSVDSTSWIMGGANGYILVPRFAGRGQLDFSRPRQIRVTELGGARGQVAGLGSLERAHFEEYVSGMGLSLVNLRYDQAARNQVNIRCYMAAAHSAGVNMFFSTWMREGANQSFILTKVGATQRLLSYFEVSPFERDFAQYASMGYIDGTLRSEAADFGLMAYRARRASDMAARLEKMDGQEEVA